MMPNSTDNVFAALSDATRRHVLERLAEGDPLSTRELARGFPISRWAVMKHLGVLRDAGLIATLPQGRRRLHFLDRRGLEEARRWLERLT